MGKRREEKVTPPEVDWNALPKQVVHALNSHHLLDAARKAAAALESVSNEFGVKVSGDLNIVPFEETDVHRSAHGHVRNDSVDEPQYNVSVDYNATA